LRTQVHFSSATDCLAAAHIKLGDAVQAGTEYEQSLALLEPLSRASPDNMEVLYALAETYTGRGNVAAKLAEVSNNRNLKTANWAAARDWFQKSQNTWSKVSNPARISSSLMEVTVPAEVSRRLAACNAELASLRSSAALQ